MYTSIAPHYDIIFPYNETTHHFLDKYLPQGTIFDIACGTGTYALALHNDQRTIYASDLDPAMIEQAQQKNDKNVFFSVADMTSITSEIPVQGIYMIGNSMVHAESLQEVQEMITRYYSLLDEQGTLILQLVNYERVLNKGITILPLIKNDKVTFHREYYFNQDYDLQFQTILEIGKERTIDRVTLFPLTKPLLEKVLITTGFHQLKWFGSYEEKPYDKDTSFHTIVVCQK